MEQNYISNKLHHFIGRSIENDDLRFQLLIQIIKTGWISPPPHRQNESSEIEFRPTDIFDSYELLNPKVVCFCDIPINDLKLHMSKYSQFGLSFSKEFLIANGAMPVFYVPKNAIRKLLFSDKLVEIDQYVEDPYETHIEHVLANGKIIKIPLKDYFNDWYKRIFFIHEYLRRLNLDNIESKEHKKLVEVLEPVILDFIPYIFSFIKTFDDSLSFSHEDNYYLEREWRIPGSLNFSTNDIKIIFIPKKYSSQLKTAIPDYKGNLIFSDKL